MKAVLLVLLLTVTFAAARGASDGAVQKPFEGREIRMDLSVGDYDVVPGHSDQIRATWVTGTATQPGTAPVVIEVNGSSAHVIVSGTSHNFHATIEVPKSVDLQVHQESGGLRIGEIDGNKDLESSSGHIVVQVANPDRYGHVEATVQAGNLFATPFEHVKSGLARSFKWDGKGKFQLRVRLGAGDINFVPGDDI